MLLPRAAAVLAALATLLLPGVASGATCGPDVPQGRLYRDEMNADTECGSECGRSCFQRADVEANIYLAGDYDARVGDARPTFLEECTGAFVQAGHGVACRQVHDDQASIRVVVGGPEDDVHAAREAARDTGLALQSFPPQLFLEPFDPMYCTRYVGFEKTCWADTAYGVCQPKGQESYNLIMRETDVRKQYKLKAGCGRLVPQQCLDADAAATTFQGATCAAIQANALCAGDAYKFKTCAGQGQCGCPAEGEPGHVKGATWGLSSDCSSGGSCLAGCSADGQSFTGGALTAKQLSDLAAEASSGETTLNSAMDALAGHIKGTSVLSRSNLAAQSIKFEQFGALLKRTPALVKKAFDLVDTFESSSGGALFAGFFINPSTGKVSPRGAFKRKATSTDGHELERAMLQVQQVLMDDVYNAGVLSECSRAVFAGRGWKTASFYPGAAPPPTDTNLVHSVVVKAVFPKTWGKAVAYARDHAQKPTGLYLSPGSIGTVTVPTILVGKGYRILVGAQVSDNKWKSEVRRMDRVATRFEITTATTLIANPLGGGVYIMVPPLADAGLVEVKISGGVIKAPLFQRTSFNQMTNAEWKARRTAPAPWADFETDNFMLNVPRSWIYAYDDPEALMERYAKSMEGAAEWLGYPPAYRNRKVLFVGVDLHIKASAYGIGYPQVNTNYNAGRDYGGNYNHWMLQTNDPGWAVCYHELGHAQLMSKYPGETEAINNFMYTFIAHTKFGVGFDKAFNDGQSHSNYGPDDAAVHWMITPNFRAGSEMDHSNTEHDQMRYQHRGYAKYADIVRLFGWEAFTKFYYQENRDHNAGTFIDGGTDGRTLRFSKAAGVDLRALIHFWGAHPRNEASLKTAVESAGLQPSLQVRCLLERYKTIIPADRAAFGNFYGKIHPGKKYTNQNPLYGIGWYHVQSSKYSSADAAKGRDRIDALLQKYFPASMLQQSCAGVQTGTAEVAVPAKWSWMPSDGKITVGGDGAVTKVDGADGCAKMCGAKATRRGRRLVT